MVSTWSQLSQGSRLSADSSYRDDLLLPCSRDPSSEEGSDTRDLSEEEFEPVNELKQEVAAVPDNGCDEKESEEVQMKADQLTSDLTNRAVADTGLGDEGVL